VVYSNPTLPQTTIAILDGGANIEGDKIKVSFQNGLNTTAPGFIAEMYLGISFSYPNQSSTVTVNNTVISKTSGGYDDGEGANGGLITVGGYDDPYSSLLPEYSDDHERYNISSYINNGDREINITTINPSKDDNIFLAVFNITGEGDVEVTNPVTDNSCKININGVTISGTREVGSPITFTLDADNSCSDTIYYRFSYHGGYGTDAYDGLHWNTMGATEYQTSNTMVYTFDEVGKYIVVIWAKNQSTDSNDGVEVIGFSVNISEQGEEPYFPF
jgi:hypothetical protein